MCGLVGVFGNLFQRDVDFFKQALVADYFRGEDSTGIAAVGHSGVQTYKNVLDPITFLDLRTTNRLLGIDKKALLGHNRKATFGGVTRSNAHPFQHGKITLTHNGSLTQANKSELERKYYGKVGEFSTDSEMICALFNTYGYKEIIPQLEGAFAFVWYDLEEQALYMVNNGKREFAAAVTPNKVYYASEKKMLQWLLDRNGITLSGEGHTIGDPKPGKLMKFKYVGGKVEGEVEEVELKKEVKKSVTYHPSTKTRTATTNSTNTTNYAGGIAGHQISLMNRALGCNFNKGDKVYGHVEAIEETNTKGRYAIEMTLARFPFTELNMHYIALDDRTVDAITESLMSREPYIIRTELMNARWDRTAGWCMIADNTRCYSVDSSKQQKRFDAWCGQDLRTTIVNMPAKKSEQEEKPQKEDSQAALPPAKSDTSSSAPISSMFVRGFSGDEVHVNRFKALCNNNCAICNSPIDAEAQLKERDVQFISRNDIICNTCATNKEYQKQYGFTPEYVN